MFQSAGLPGQTVRQGLIIQADEMCDEISPQRNETPVVEVFLLFFFFLQVSAQPCVSLSAKCGLHLPFPSSSFRLRPNAQDVLIIVGYLIMLHNHYPAYIGTTKAAADASLRFYI